MIKPIATSFQLACIRHIHAVERKQVDAMSCHAMLSFSINKIVWDEQERRVKR